MLGSQTLVENIITQQGGYRKMDSSLAGLSHSIFSWFIGDTNNARKFNHKLSILWQTRDTFVTMRDVRQPVIIRKWRETALIYWVWRDEITVVSSFIVYPISRGHRCVNIVIQFQTFPLLENGALRDKTTWGWGGKLQERKWIPQDWDMERWNDQPRFLLVTCHLLRRGDHIQRYFSPYFPLLGLWGDVGHYAQCCKTCHHAKI